ncbi:hypothetical protein B0I35DRAFT_483157 [Stachybotrys elegans]|uniref:Uncharacterized protein n=1 Tax=Stachybotrys elegans TaxID=80388 RepID=A0A8K0WL68_9HYPO|nr:hypothetical protein B0I35DRAFT_483157 [Stachybotrys elegans]
MGASTFQNLLSTPELVFLYQNAVQDNIEYKVSAFWQHYLALKFPPEKRYIISHEHSPDNRSRRRVDILVQHLFPDPSVATTILMTECKRRCNSKFNDLEKQLLGYAESYFRANPNIGAVGGMTVWGTKARVWTLEANWNRDGVVAVFIPRFGPCTSNDKAWYIDAGHVESWYIEEAVCEMTGSAPPPRPEELDEYERS